MTGGDPPVLTGSPQVALSAKSSNAQAGNTAPDEFFSQCFLSTQLAQSATVVATFRSKLKGKDIDVTNVGRLGVLLARCSFFGDDFLQVSTLKGKGNRRGLDPHKLKSLLTEIHGQAFPFMNKEDFFSKGSGKSRANSA